MSKIDAKSVESFLPISRLIHLIAFPAQILKTCWKNNWKNPASFLVLAMKAAELGNTYEGIKRLESEKLLKENGRYY